MSRRATGGATVLCLLLVCTARLASGQLARDRDGHNSSRARPMRQSVWSSEQDTSRPATFGRHWNKCNEATGDGPCDEPEGRRSSMRPLVRGAGEPQARWLSRTEAQPDLNQTQVSTSTTAGPPQSGLITRTSDAIYRALSGYFSHDDELTRIHIKPNVSIKSTTTTPMPKQQTTTLKPVGQNGTTTKPPFTSTTRRPTTSTTVKTTTTTTTTNSPKIKNKPKSTTTSPPTLQPTSHDRDSNYSDSTINSSKITSATTTTTTTTTTTIRPKVTNTTTTTTPPPPTTTTTTSRPETTQATPTMQPHLDLNSYKDEPQLVTSTTSTTKTPTTPRLRVRPTTTTKRPKPGAVVTTIKPTPSSKSPLELIDAEEQRHNSSSLLAPGNTIKNSDGGAAITDQENSLEFFSFLNRAINSVYSINELTYLNRTTRLVHESEGAESSPGDSTASLLPATGADENDASRDLFAGEREREPYTLGGQQHAQKLQQPQQQMTTREDIMLLCKLLHKHLENGSIIASNGAFLAPNGTNLIAANMPVSNQKQQQTTSAATTTTTTTTERPRNFLREFVAAGLSINDPQNELNESHAGHLLESIFTLERRAPNELAYEDSGLRLLADLFNAGFRNKFATYLNLTGSQDVPSQTIAPIQLKSWSRTVTGGRTGGRMKLVYWLVMPAGEPTSQSQPPLSTSDAPKKFKVLDSEEANELLDQLEHAFVQQSIDDTLLLRPIVLVAAHQKQRAPTQTSAKPGGDSNSDDDDLLKAVSPPSAHVVDDKLAPGDSKASWGFQNFVERLINAPFQENLQLYLILLLVLLFLVIMCFALPLICCKSCALFRRRSESSAALAAATLSSQAGGLDNKQANLMQSNQLFSGNGKRTRPRQGGARATRRKASDRQSKQPARDQIISSVSGDNELPGYARRLGQANFDDGEEEEVVYYKDDYGLARHTSGTINEAVWTKLSNSTTTLTKDRTRIMYDEGQRDLPILRQLDASGDAGEKMKRFEWYTFEDKTTTQLKSRNYDKERGQLETAADKRDQQSQTLTDHLKMTKSVQTYADEEAGRQADEPNQRLVNMSFSDRLETRNSDTLTKSELVMLKEKLIPISARKQSATGETDQVRDLRPKAPERDYVNQPTRHIDSSIDDSTNGMSKSLVNPISLHSSSRDIPAAPLTTTAQGATQEDQRTPKMRYLELPNKTQSKVEAIKDELERIEAREMSNRGTGGRPAVSTRREEPSRPTGQSSSSYKRYDVV